jgi:hypothetical protein
MKILAFIIAATIFEAVGDAVMRIALHPSHRSEIGTPSTKCRLRMATFSSGV